MTTLPLASTAPPPYPPENTPVHLLPLYLRHLVEWIRQTSPALETAWGSPVIAVLPVLPTVDAYVARPVAVTYRHLLYLRKLRECWDHLVREYADQWTTDTAVRCRTMLLQHADNFLGGVASPSQEVVEATQGRILRDLVETFSALTANAQMALRPFTPPGEEELCGITP